jgi:hypothetical protein
MIDDALRSLHITGSLLLRETYAPPWSIAIPDARRLSDLLGFGANTRAVAFHLVEFGQCAITLDGCELAVISAGEMAICIGGQPHQLLQGRSGQPQPVETLLAGGPNIQRPSARHGVGGASLPWGVFLLQEGACNPLLTSMPSVLHSSLSRPVGTVVVEIVVSRRSHLSNSAENAKGPFRATVLAGPSWDGGSRGCPGVSERNE